MEVARAAGGFLMPHQMYHERRPASAAPAAATGGGPRRIRMHTAPHEFYDVTMAATPSVNFDGDDAEPASFSAWFPSGRFGGVPAAASAVEGLPETTVGAGGEEMGDGEETCCAVCLEGYQAGDALRTMPCAPAFHGECIVEWLSVSRFCPLCRFKLPTQAEEDAAGQHQQAASLG
ncbi:RING finger protein 44-like [Panicum virgatum]|uniref:RING-type domain-containing protein n=1 Tax=Panicum virgatum TaxID=38727 RepID=A0A8T0TZN2_PANVG|nr:RING finger protein 44-like [Panicum virgatum]KAG2614805.1 hypothetical protein PVAP13_3NG009800 [Panicum virgatum]